MPEDSSTLRGIHWRQVLPFTQLFRGFRIAVHPSKMILGLLALLIFYAGGRAVDAVWPLASRAVVEPYVDNNGNIAAQTEIERFEELQKTPHQGVTFSDVRADMRRRVEEIYVNDLLIPLGVYKNLSDARNGAANGYGMNEIEAAIQKRRSQDFDDAERVYNDVTAAAKLIPDPEMRRAALEDAAQARHRAVQAAYADTEPMIQKARAIRGQGLFRETFVYEVHQVNGVVDGVLTGNWLGGMHGNPAPAGVAASVMNFLTVAPLWLIRCHTVFFVIFALWFMVIWAVFGGAIARIAAVHLARDERISMRAALKFSTGKFLSFIFAPIIPLVIVLFVGLLVYLCSFIGDIPWVGPALVGAFFFLALAAGFVMTLILLGMAGGFNIMYPTIAVEGSDSFDAISRSFSYVYARPWRMLFLTVVAVIYGTLTYEFVHLFVVLLVHVTHFFVGSSMNLVPALNTSPQWDTMWPITWGRLTYEVHWDYLTWYQLIGARLVQFWVYLLVATVGAYAISYYVSSNTIIYYLMRREVDATDMDDVYMEQTDEELPDTAPAESAPADATESAPPQVDPAQADPAEPAPGS